MCAPAVVCKCRLIVIFDFLRNVVSGGVWAATGRPYGMNCAKQKATVRRGRRTLRSSMKITFIDVQNSQVPSVSAEQTSCATLSCRACIDETICVAVRYL